MLGELSDLIGQVIRLDYGPHTLWNIGQQIAAYFCRTLDLL